MDNNSLTTAGVTAALTAALGVLYKIYMVVNHKRIRSSCCGQKLEASIDIENTTPPEIVVPSENFIQNPMKK